MAKGNMLLGQARGKVGDLVFSRNNGKQVIKARSEVVRNPQTTAQTLQRILLNTVSQAYSVMLPICDHSFEGVKVGQDTMAVFMKQNLNRIRARVTNLKNTTGGLTGFYSVAPIGFKNVTLNNYIMATGKLPQIKITSLELSTPGAEVAQIEVPGAPALLTYQDFINAFGLRGGDQITFCQLSYAAGEEITFGYSRVILAPVDEDGIVSSLDVPMIVDGAINNPNGRNEGSFARLSYNEGVLSFSLTGNAPVGACVIVSRQSDNGEWERSNSVMFVAQNPQAYGQWSLLDAIDLFYTGGMDLGSDYYLNNAQNGNQGEQSSEASAPYLTAVRIAGVSALGASSTHTVQPNAQAPVVAQVSNFNSEANSKLVLTQRELTIGSIFDSQAGDIVVALNAATTNTTVDLSSDASYHTYFISGGMVVSKHANINVVTPETAHFTQATFGGTSLLSQQTITSITEDTQATLAVNASVVGLSTPKVKIVKTNTQPTVGGTIASGVLDQALTNGAYSGSFTFADSGYHYLCLCDGNTVVEVASAINVQAAGGGNGSITPGAGD